MSRVGKQPVAIPGGVKVQVADGKIKVDGPKGKLEFSPHTAMKVQHDDKAKSISVTRPDDERLNRALHGLTRTLIANMVVGVTDGWSKELEIIGVGYRAANGGPGVLDLALGFSHPVKFTAPDGITFEVPLPTRVIVKGADKEVVGQVAASIRKIRKPEPYKGKGVRYLGERVVRKAGKAAK